MNNSTQHLSQLSNQQLESNLRALQQGAPENLTADRLQEVVQELQVHRIELEMQNRALVDAQQELQQSVCRFTSLYDRLPIGYVTVTPQGRIVEANARAIAWLQTKRPDLLGAYLRSFVNSQDALRLSAHLEACAQQDAEERLEITLRFHDGGSLPVQLASQRAPAPGGAVQIHVAMSDISALKHTQQTLEAINAELDAFSHAVSHDLRAPLLNISTFAQVVLEEHTETLTEDGRMMVQRMRNASVRMQETLKQLLEYSRLIRRPMNIETVDLDAAVRDLLIEHRALIHYRKAAIEVVSPLPAVRGVPGFVDQVLRNLLSNALKYTLPDRAPRVRIAASVHGARVVLQIKDQGIGIESQKHSQVFKMFERLHGHSNYPGAGLGLAIVRRAVERMDGRVWLESTPGEGSTFFVELPKA
jgi:PAS domain S-box-containing protein